MEGPKIKFKLPGDAESSASTAPATLATSSEQHALTNVTFRMAAPTTTSLSSNPISQKRRKRKVKKHDPDSDEDESLHPIEEHLILRMPKDDPISEKFREIVKKRQALPGDFEITFKDNRRGVFKFDGESLIVRLVDLPCIIESQKTFDRRQFYKIADICQMLQVTRLPSGTTEQSINALFSQPYNPDEMLENSGITPPLKFCRVRRFRKRVNRRTVESIEREVQRLLKEDAKALEVEHQFIDAAELEERLQRDDEFGDEDEVQDEELDDDDSDDGDGSVAASDFAELEDEIARALGDASSESEGDDDDQEGDEQDQPEDQDQDEEMDAEMQMLVDQQRLLKDEMKDLEEKLKEKVQQRDKAVNALLQKRFDDIVNRLQNEMNMKRNVLLQLEEQIEETRLSKEEEANEMAQYFDEDENEPLEDEEGSSIEQLANQAAQAGPSAASPVTDNDTSSQPK